MFPYHTVIFLLALFVAAPSQAHEVGQREINFTNAEQAARLKSVYGIQPRPVAKLL